MIGYYFRLIIDMIQFLFQGKNTLSQTRTTMKALVDSIVPNTPGLAEKQAAVQTAGAMDLYTDEFQIFTLDHYISLKIIFKNYNIYLANATAKMLDAAAAQLISRRENATPVNPVDVSEKGAFAALEAADRCRALVLLEQLLADLSVLPVPFRNNPVMVLGMVSILTMLTTGGYYSEWHAYGTTRLIPPQQRKTEQFPTSWKQIGYPGPSKGYHAYRGQIVQKFSE